MPQTYKKYIRWDLPLGDIKEPEEKFSVNRMKKFRKAMRKFEDSDYNFDIIELSPTILNEFVIIYNEYIGKKEHGIVYPVREMIKDGWNNGRVYNIIRLLENNKLIGGLIFRHASMNQLSVAYRVFPTELKIKTSLGAAYICEYLLIKRAVELNVKLILHGRDRNAYGLNSDIGLAMYKLRAGALPHISASKDNPVIELPDNLDNDVLVCTGTEPKKMCDELILYTNLTDDEVAKKYSTLQNVKDIPLRIVKR